MGELGDRVEGIVQQSTRGNSGTGVRGAAGWTVRAAVAAAAAVLPLTALPAGQAAASRAPAAVRGQARWSVQPTPAPPALPILSSVSCSSARACTAVGQHDTRSGATAPLAERWDGIRWDLQPAAFSSDAGLLGVSCPAARECVAVGGAPGHSLAELWNGSRWTIQPTPSPNGTQIELTSVACPRPADCFAVGGYQAKNRTPHPLAMRWNGHAWRMIRSMPLPPDIGLLAAVSCSGPAACTAVGNYSAPRANLAYAVRWDGRAWALQLIAGPPGKNVILSGVSCPAATMCLAAGSSLTKAGNVPVELAERWNGSAWMILRTPAPPGQAGAIGGGFTAASCHSARLCVVVGSFGNSRGDTRALAERWNGNSWLIQPVPDPAPAMTELSWVSCPTARTCTAVGSAGLVRRTLAERNTGE